MKEYIISLRSFLRFGLFIRHYRFINQANNKTDNQERNPIHAYSIQGRPEPQ